MGREVRGGGQLDEIRLVAVDLDGTLLRSDKTMAPEGVALLLQAVARGVHVILATTRNPESACAIASELGLTGPLICSNGAQVWASPEGPVWATFTLPRHVGLSLAQLADERDWELIITVGQETYWRWRPGQSAAPVHTRVTLMDHNVDGVVGDPLRIMAWQPEAIEPIRLWCADRFPDLCRTAVFYNPDGSTECIGVFAPDAHKGTALTLVAERLGIPLSQVLAVGDQAIDVPMFQAAGVSVAMGNAPPDVQAAATWVGPCNDEEGVAWALRRVGAAE